MASTDDGDRDPPLDVVAHPLGTAYLDGLLALSRSAGWNQDADDWRSMLAAGRGWGLSLADGTVVASTVALPYGPADGGFAWVSMVLVRPEHRRRGFAARLLRDALGWLAASGRTAVLDATPAGHPVYRAEGFVDTWGLQRYERAAAGVPRVVTDVTIGPTRGPAPPEVVPLRDAHWPALLALDARAFGASREPLLRALAARLPDAARVALRDGVAIGFVLGRPGRVASQLGPLVCDDEAGALALLDAAARALPGPVFADAPDAQAAVVAVLRAGGFAPQRPFTRLVLPPPGHRGAPRAPGDASLVRLVAGPELG